MGGKSSRELPMRQRPYSKIPKQFKDVECPYPSCSTFFGKYGAINYSLDGPQDAAEVLVTFHGLNASRTMFKQIGEAIGRNGTLVLSFDMYGHGRSNAPPVSIWCCKKWRCCPCGHPRARYDLDCFVDQAVELLEGLNLGDRPLNLMGFSFGGLVAMRLAKRFPDRVIRLILMSPGGILKNDGLKRQWRLGHLVWCCLIPIANCFVWPCCYKKEKYALQMKGEDPEVIHQVWSRLVWSLFVKRGVAAASLGIMLRIDWFSDERLYAEVGSHKRPVLLLWGEHDSFNSLDVAEKIKSYFCNRHLQIVKGAYHIVVSDNPQRVYDATYDFLKMPQDVDMNNIRVTEGERPRLLTHRASDVVSKSQLPLSQQAVSRVEVHANMPAPGIIGSTKSPKQPQTEAEDNHV
jgi:pimeloyl-ACP methyl ester carboxylesterase|mmetsp:Transcript_25855/g.41460  ORF Transcript_25855/g.41460 Transcript_25855/m.41460 type:complete len:404 (+) Transcript_25855:118-1329(+)